MQLDWMHLLVLGIGLVGGALAKHVLSGAKPIIDPGNTKPAVDGMRDLIRSELVAYFGGSTPVVPVPTLPAQPNQQDLVALLHKMADLMSPKPPPAA